MTSYSQTNKLAESEKSTIDSKVLIYDLDTTQYVPTDIKYPNTFLDNGYPNMVKPFGKSFEEYEAIKLKLKDTNIKTEYKTKKYVYKDIDVSEL